MLEHLLDGDATIPPDRGLFLETTYRLHPDVCGFISEEFYEGRLQPDPVTSTRTTPLGTGLRWLAVEHEGNRQESPEEAAAVRGRDRARSQLRASALDEIKVVAPYNAQVDRAPRRLLPAAIEVGTVDKFQGQEARVVFYSMASSSGEDVPRGLEFLLSRNRLNVAISRARVPRVPRVLAAAARGQLPDDRADAARERAVPVRRAGASARRRLTLGCRQPPVQ